MPTFDVWCKKLKLSRRKSHCQASVKISHSCFYFGVFSGYNYKDNIPTLLGDMDFEDYT